MGKSQYTVTGMSCAACAARVEKTVSQVENVQACSVNLLTNTLQIEGNAESAAVKAAVEAAGYGLRMAEEALPSSRTDAPTVSQGFSWRFFLSLGLLLLLMLFSMGHRMLGLPLPFGLGDRPVWVGGIELVLSLSVLLLNGSFFVRGAKGVRYGAPNMDTLVSLGAAASFGYSLFVFFEMIAVASAGDEALVHTLAHGLYFESAAMILTLVSLGKQLEKRAKGRATDAIAALLSLAPDTAIRLQDGREARVRVEEILPGDVLVLRPGDRVPVDGRVLSGEGAFDESALTGESLPVDKKEGDPLYAATLNCSGCIRMLVEGVGDETALARVVTLVKEASATKAPMAKLADRVSAVFVPAVLAIACLTFLGWLLGTGNLAWAFRYGVSVLVISCPCALGLATPVAILVGSTRGASMGILFKTATALEYTGGVRTVVLDKTGTVTEGRPSVSGIMTVDGVREEELLALAAAAEAGSGHPLAGAILRAAEERGISFPQARAFTAHTGYGVSATVEECEILCGKAQLVSACPFPPSLQAFAAERAAVGHTPVYLSKDGVLLGCILVADEVKPDAGEAVERLKRLGVRTVLLTGDKKETAEAVAARLGISSVIAETLPDEKEAAVAALQEKGRVMMVGDGINDAIALTRADVGVAIGAGTDVAVEAADVVLTGDRLCDLTDAILLSRATVRNMKQNLFWAFFYNALGIPLAAGALAGLGIRLSPMIAAAAMSLSSVTVVSNALRLRRFTPHDGKKIKKEKRKKERRTEMKVALQIEGMMCPHCSGRVKEALAALACVEEATVSHETGMAVLTLREEAPLSLLTETVEKAGYRVTDVKK